MSAGQPIPHLQRNQPQPIRIGVIGVGNMGQHHTRVLSLLKDVELVGVSDINIERGLDTASKYRVHFLKITATYCLMLRLFALPFPPACITLSG